MDATVEIIKAVAWPLTVLIIVFGFRKPLNALVTRLKAFDSPVGKIDFDELLNQQKELKPSANPLQQLNAEPERLAPSLTEQKPPQQQQQPVSNAATTVKSEGPESIDMRIAFEKEKTTLESSPTTKKIAGLIKEGFTPLTHKYTREQLLELGTLQLAKMAMYIDFWRTYNFVFGSQIDLLQKLNMQAMPEKELALKFVYLVTTTQPDHPFKGKELRDYLEFLLNTELIKREVVGADAFYQITEKGREFLNWCVACGLSFTKPY